MLDRPLEWDLWEQSCQILGLDEAGRGPMAGPLAVAGVVFPAGYQNGQIDDSKKLSEKKREALYGQIMQDALWYQVLFIPEADIDRLNIYAATQQAMSAIANTAPADYVLSDAMKLHTPKRYEAIIKGDQKSISIAAASILAKVSRDRYMKKLGALYPQYGLEKHKGYPTRAHIQALEQYGVQDFYRRSYGPVKKVLDKVEEITLF